MTQPTSSSTSVCNQWQEAKDRLYVLFKQSPDLPENEFIIGAKLEAQNPQSQMACVATVIGVQGPRVRLQLDRSDTKNDFFKMVDASVV